MSGANVTGEHNPSKRDVKTGLPIKFRLSKRPEAFNYSVSSQPDVDEYQRLLVLLAKAGAASILVIDLRDEEHVFINDGESIAFEDPEHTGMETILNKYLTTPQMDIGYKIYSDPSINFEPLQLTQMQTEEKFINSKGHDYCRLPIKNHSLPSAQVVDELINILRARHEEEAPVWVHFHCHGGNARSAIMAAITVLVTLKLNGELEKYDSVQKALQSNLDEESLNRIYKIKSPKSPDDKQKKGSVRSKSSSDDESGEGKIAERQEFIAKFFDYLVDNFERETWTEHNRKSSFSL